MAGIETPNGNVTVITAQTGHCKANYQSRKWNVAIPALHDRWLLDPEQMTDKSPRIRS